MINNSSSEEDSSILDAGVSPSRRWAVSAIVGLGVVVATGAMVLCWHPWVPVRSSGVPTIQPSVPANQDDDFDAPAAVRNPGYLGPQACAPCHAQRVAELQATSHFRACRTPQAEALPQGFDPGRGTYVARNSALRFEMTRLGGDFTQTAFHTTPKGEQRASARIDLVYGTGTADEIFFTWRGNGLWELPIAWLHPQKRWAEQPFDPYGTGNFARTTTPRCLECHNTWIEHMAGTNNQYKRDNLILGVTCEKCHGPGREHVAFHQAHPEAAAAHAIVHPGHLTRDRQIDVCGQCHSNAPKRRGPAFSYRPGKPLEAFFRTNLDKHQEKDHVANQVEYLRQSKCFQKSDALTCITCHNPHQKTDSASVQRSCQKCHKPKDCAEQNRLPAAVRGNCVGCHMPQFTRIQVFFHTRDDQYVAPMRPRQHRVAVYPAARQEVLLGWYREQSDAHSRQEAAHLTKELVSHWLAEAEKFRREYRFLAAIGAVREALRIDPAPATRQKLHELAATQAKLDADWFTVLHQVNERLYSEAIETLTKMLAIKPDLANAHGKLGTLYADAGKMELAVEHLQAVAQYDPDDASGYAMLGWLAFVQGRMDDAVAAYALADEIEPFDAKTNYHMGVALARLGRLPEAAKCFRHVLSADPNHEGGCQGLSDALRRQGHATEALRFALRSARLTRFQNPDILITLAEAYASAGRFTEAEDTLTKALDAAPTSDPKLKSQIHQRMLQIRVRAKETPK